MLDFKRHFCVLNNESPRTDVWKKQMRKAMRVITKKDKFKPETPPPGRNPFDLMRGPLLLL